MSRPEGFAAVPNWMVRDESFDIYDIAVYTALASHTGPGGVRPSQATLAREARCSRRKVIEVVQHLADRGVLQIVKRRRKGSGNGGGGSLTNGYILTPHGPLAEDDEFVSPEESARGAHSVVKRVHPTTEESAQESKPYLSIEEEPVEEEKSDLASEALPPMASPDVVRLCELLAEKVRANGHKVGAVGVTWWAACDRLMRLDHYTPQQIEWMIHWSTSDEFWAANIQSMPTLRAKFSKMVLDAKRAAKQQQQASPGARASNVVEMGRRLAAAGVR